MHEHLREICDGLEFAYRDLSAANNQLRENGGQFDPARMSYYNQLTHAIKSLETTKAMLEAKDAEEHGDYGDRGRYGHGWRMPYPAYYRGGYGDGDGYDRPMGGYSRNQDRDGRGRYADDGMREKLRAMMASTRDEGTRMELQRMMDAM